jgi:Glycosyl hydrolases family 17
LKYLQICFFPLLWLSVWPLAAEIPNGRGINPEMVNEENQRTYFEYLMAWTAAENILTFVFEAFDEDWKGSPEPLEPEKHWGLFKKDRRPKLVMQGYFVEGV